MTSLGSEPVRVILIGAGDRGRTYCRWIADHGRRMKLVAAADPRPERLELIAREHHLTPASCFSDWRVLSAAEIGAEAVIIATPDRMHRQPAEHFLRHGLHVLLEKPMAVSPEGLESLVAAADEAERNGGSLTVCHVLRYTAFFRRIKSIIESHDLGDIVSFYHAENVARHHMAHSYVRGNWSNSGESSPFILAKSSHDLDLICWLLDSRPRKLAANAGRGLFYPEKAPSGAPERCTDGCPAAAECPYEARRTYLYGMPMKKALSRAPGITGLAASLLYAYPRFSSLVPGLRRYRYWRDWPTSTISSDLTPAGVERALREGPYGCCVYACDNDQPERHETIIEFQSGAAAVFRLHGMSHQEGRTLRIDGTRGTLRARFGGGSEIRVYPQKGNMRCHRYRNDFVGHAEADQGLMDHWDRICHGETGPSSAGESALSHLLALESHRAAQEGTVIRIDGQ